MNISLDLDGVLVDFPSALAKKVSEKLKREFTVAEMTTYNVEGFLPSKLHSWSNKLLKTPSFYDECVPTIDSQEVVNNLSSLVDIYVVTARPLVLKKQTTAYVKKYFPKVKEVIFSTKSKIPSLSEWDISLHLDDSPTICADIASSHLNVISCVYNQPFNCNLADQLFFPHLKRFYNFKSFQEFVTKLWLERT